MSARDISAELRAWTAAEIDAQCFGEDFGFDVVPQAAITPQAAMAQYAFVITMRSPLLGQGPLLHVVVAQSPRPSRDDVKTLVTQALQGLRGLSRQLMAGANGQPA